MNSRFIEKVYLFSFIGLFLLSGGLIGYGVGFLFEHQWIGMLISIGISILVIGIVMLNLYYKKIDFNEMRELFKSKNNANTNTEQNASDQKEES